jgi:hypothetical protein
MSKPLSAAERQRKRLAKFKRQLPGLRRLREEARAAGRWHEVGRLDNAIGYRERIVRQAEKETAQP